MREIMAMIAAALLAGCAATSSVPATVDSNAVLTSPVKGVRHIGITVSDIDDSIAFYAPNLPFELVRRYSVPASSFPAGVLARRHGDVEIALIRTPTVFIQLMDFDPAAPADPLALPVTGPGYTHICWQSP